MAPRILITGVTGFVGSNLVKYFSQFSDYSLFGHSRDNEKAQQQFHSYGLQLVDDYSTASLDKFKIDAVIYLAGIAHDLSNKYKAEDYHKVNYESTKKAYDEFLRSNASKFIFVSSIKAAVDITREPVSEEVIPNPVTDYGKSKLKVEQYMLSTSVPRGKYFYILRPGMIHGPGNKGNLNLLYRFVKTGIPFPFGAFNNQRSFLSIDNFNFAIQQLLQKEIAPGIYHLADDGFISTKELYKVIATAIRKRPIVLNIPASWILTTASILGKKHLINKLTEDMMVSNKKIKEALGVALPIALRDGIYNTIQSFNK
jgi:nucleoside-diphosphate-sugar epimerase